MPFDPTTAKEVMMFDPSTAQEVQETPEQTQGLGMDTVDKLNAAFGGVAQGLVKTAANVGGLVTDPLPQSIQQPVRAAGRAVGQILSPQPDSIPGQAMQENPRTATVGDVLGQTLPYAAPGISGLKGNIATGALAGAASTEDGFLNRLVGATGGAATAGVLSAAGTALQMGVSALRSTNVVKAAEKYVADKVNDLAKTLKGTPREIGAQSAANVYTATRKTDAEMFNAFRNVEGNVAPEIRTVKRAIEDMLDTYGDNMSGAQKQALQSGLKQFESAGSIADLHDLRKYLAKNRLSFTPNNGSVFTDAYAGIQKTVDNAMETGADKLGVLQEYKNANTFYKSKMLPLINAGTDDVAKALSEQGKLTNPQGAAKVLDEWVDRNIKPNKPNETKAFLNTLDPVGRDAVELRLIERTLEKTKEASNLPLAFRKEFAKYGATSDILLSGENKRIMAGVMRVLDEAKPLIEQKLKKGEILNMPVQMGINTLVKMTDNATGQFMLKILGEPSTPRKIVSEILSKGSSIFGGQVAEHLIVPSDDQTK